MQAERNILTLPRREPKVAELETAKKQFDPKNGHEAILRTIIKKRADVVLTLNDGSAVYGRISQFDNFTITVYPDDNDGMPETFFKHSIRSFTQATSDARGE